MKANRNRENITNSLRQTLALIVIHEVMTSHFAKTALITGHEFTTQILNELNTDARFPGVEIMCQI